MTGHHSINARSLWTACFLAFYLTSALLARGQGAGPAAPSLDEAFTNPPASTRPFVYWYWISNNISRDGIRKDLEAMARLGIGGVNIGIIEYIDAPKGNVPIFSEEWWDCLTLAMEEAARLGIQVNLFNSPGWSGTGGAWVKPEQAMRYLDVHEYRVRGPRRLVMTLPDYHSTERLPQLSTSFQYEIDKSRFKFQPVALLAFPAPPGSRDRITAANAAITSKPALAGVEALFDNDEATTVSFGAFPVTLEMEVKAPMAVRSLEVVPANAPFHRWIRLDYLDEKGQWIKVVTRRIARSETRILASGFLPFAPVSISFPAVRARKFRITLSETENGAARRPAARAAAKKEEPCLAEIRLSGAARVDSYAEKQLANKASYDRTAPASDAAHAVRKEDVRDLASHVDAQGVLTWDVPAGDWILHHSGMSQTGVQVHPVTAGLASGFAADIMSKKAIQASFDAYIGQILKRIPPEKRKTLKQIVLDSYEQGSANWTDGLADKFKAACGYDPLPWTPVLKGHVVESGEQSERFLWDLRRLVADLMPENFSGAIAERSRQHGLTLWHEPYGGHGFPGEFLNSGKYTDTPAGEFWVPRPPETFFPQCRAASSVANAYGRAIVSVEAFTSAGPLYSMMPRNLKAPGDWAMAQGLNHFTFHVYVHQPDDRKPGINTWYGTEFNRNNTWFPEAKSFVDYVRRATALLQRGRRQTDIAIYIGGDVPCDNAKLPYAVPQGYDLDFLNDEVLLNLARVEDGRLVLDSGAAYRVLALPPGDAMRPELLEKLEAFVEAGLTVYGPRPQKSPSLRDFPRCDARVRDIAGRLWGKIDGKNIFSNRHGKGRVFWGLSLADCLAQVNLSPDAAMPEGFVFTHRKDGAADIYFVANQQDKERAVELSFRTTNGRPELWDALTGEKRALDQYFAKNGRTIIPLRFPRAGSFFVVFRGATRPSGAGRENFPSFTVAQTLSGGWDVTLASGISAPFRRNFAGLTDWTASDDKEIKYFSGKATYAARFNFVGKLPGVWHLNLGRVESLAKIRLNGKELPALWCYPYRANVSDFLMNGENRLEIEVMNQWWNRLVGDEQPGAIRNTHVSSRLFWKAGDALIPSGLIGPVTLESDTFE